MVGVADPRSHDSPASFYRKSSLYRYRKSSLYATLSLLRVSQWRADYGSRGTKIPFTSDIYNVYIFLFISSSAKPPAPKFTLTSNTPTSATVSLTPPGVSGITGYRLQYSQVGGKGKQQRDLGAVTSYELTG